MPQPTAADLWTALGRSRLLGPAALSALQREYAQQPAAKGDDATAVAKWLIGRGSLTTWQAKRLLAGDRGPYVLGEYRLLDRSEHPGHVPLFTARHDPSGRTVDVVLLSSRRCQDPAAWQGIVRRTTAAIGATDPVLSRTWALEQTEAARFLVCEHVDGRSLGAVLERDGPLPPRTAGALALRIARAVATLHARDEVHGGLSLDAVRLPGTEGPADPQAVRLLQYPLVGDPHQDPPRVPLTSDEEIARLGARAAFVAPELTRPDAVCDARSDVYAIGCMLHALLTGHLPGWAGDPRATLRQAATAGVPPLGAPVVPDEVGTLVGYLTARDSDGRYRTAGEAADAIAACFAIDEQPAFAGVAAAVPGLVVTTAPAARTARRRAPERRGFPLGVASVAIALVGLGLAATMWLDPFGMRRPAAPESPPGESVAQAPPDAVPVVDAAAAVPPQEPAPPPDGRPNAPPPTAAAPILVDDDALPWAAPTHGAPVALSYLPNGSQLLLVIRPADILAAAEGPLFFKSLGPVVESAATWLAAVSGCGLDGIESVHAGWQTAADGTVLGACVIRLAGGRTIPADDAFRTRQWGAEGVGQVAGETIQRAGRWAFWTPQAEVGRVLVVAPGDLIETVVRGGTEPPTLAGDLETLVEKLDDRRHVTVAAATHFLFTEGRGVFVGPLDRLGDPLEAFLGDEVRAVALAAHLGEAFYAEIDAVGTLDASAAGLVPVLRSRLDALPDEVEEYIAGLAPHPHGRRLVLRLPGMLRALTANLRSGAEGRAAVLNAYLPRHAGHNLALAGELVLAQSPGAAPAAVATAAAAPAAVPQDALARLQKPMTLVFARDTLEKSVQMVAEEAGVPIEINGRDLELEGITKNQSFGLAERDTTADAVLRTILAKSNPDGKLVYVVRRQDGAETIEVTTRAAVAKRGDTLPPGFAADAGTEATGEKR